MRAVCHVAAPVSNTVHRHVASATVKIARSPGGRFARKGTHRIAAQWRERNDDFVAVGRRATCATPHAVTLTAVLLATSLVAHQ